MMETFPKSCYYDFGFLILKESSLGDILKEYSDDLVKERLLALFQECGACLDTTRTRVHYLLSSGSHSGRFYNLKLALQYRDVCELLVLILFQKLAGFGILESISAVIGPEKGADPLIYMLLHYLPANRVRAVSFKKVGKDEMGRDVFLPPTGIQVDAKDSVLILDDVFTTGGSIKSVIRGCNEAYIAGVGCCVNRAPRSWSSYPSWVTTPIIWALRDPVDDYSEDNCPFCKKRVALVKV